MTTRSSSKSNTKPAPKASAPRSKSTELDAIALLESDHKKVKKLFKEFEKLAKADDESKVEVAAQICQELTVHAQVEEEIFYPAAYEAFAEPDLVDEAQVEHATAKDLIAQIESMDGSEDLYDATVKVLAEYINHHVEEEEGEMFPKARRTKMDLEELGAAIAARKEELAP